MFYIISNLAEPIILASGFVHLKKENSGVINVNNFPLQYFVSYPFCQWNGSENTSLLISMPLNFLDQKFAEHGVENSYWNIFALTYFVVTHLINEMDIDNTGIFIVHKISHTRFLTGHCCSTIPGHNLCQTSSQMTLLSITLFHQWLLIPLFSLTPLSSTS